MLLAIAMVVGQAAFLASEWWLSLWAKASDQSESRWGQFTGGWRRAVVGEALADNPIIYTILMCDID
jgi:hypothetical protein